MQHHHRQTRAGRAASPPSFHTLPRDTHESVDDPSPIRHHESQQRRAPPDLEISYYVPGITSMRPVAELCAHLPVEHARTLVLGSAPPGDGPELAHAVSIAMTRADWFVMCKNMVRLTALQVHQPAERGLAAALAFEVPPAAPGGSALPFLQNLQVLVFDDVAIRPNPPVAMDDVHEDGIFEVYCEAFEMRRRLDRPLRRVLVQDCINVVREDIHFLLELVDDVFYDGRQRWRTDARGRH